jgi:hypothetical protein
VTPPLAGRHHFALRLAALFALALTVRLILVALRYTPEFARFQSGDYILYRIGAEHFLTNHNFSNSLFLARPPLFALLIAALNVSDLAVLLADCALGALIAPVTVLVARGLALAAGLAVTLDPASVVYSAFLGPEPLANLLLMLMLLALLGAIHAPKDGQALAWGGLAGLLLVAGSATRPASYLLWTGLGVWLVLARRRRWLAAALFMAISALGVGAWVVHNGQVFGHATFSTVGSYTQVYYRAASVEHLATGDAMDAVYTRINQRVETLLGRDPSAADAGYMHRYLAATPPVAAALNQVAGEIMGAHPLIAALTLPVGFVRMYGLLPDRVALFRNDLPWALLEMAWNALLLGGALVGLRLAFRRREWTLLWLPLLTGGYFTAGVLLVKSVGDVRERSVLLPLLAILAVYAADAGARAFTARRAKNNH